MALLTGHEILRQMDLGNIRIDPCSREHVGPNSIDVHIGTRLLRYSEAGRRVVRSPLHGGLVYAIDSRAPPLLADVQLLPSGSEPGWLLEPGTLYLGCTMEYTETTGFVPRIDGRSTTGRLGIACHITAGLGDNGFKGTWTLEFFVVEPVIIYPGQRLCQLTFETLDGEQTFYGETGNTSGRYQGQVEPEGPIGDGNERSVSHRGPSPSQSPPRR